VGTDGRSENLLDHIKTMIVDKRLVPGDRLPTETQLAKRFGVSRHKLREELRSLTVMGILKAAPRRGTVVRAYDPDQWATNLAFHGKVNGYELAEAQEARIAMELSVIPLAIRNATTDDWLRFELLLSRMELSLDDKDYVQFKLADQEFHELLVETTHNPVLQMLRPMIRWIFDELLRSSAPSSRSCKRSYVEHKRIVKAMRRRNVAQAQKALAAHLRLGLESIRSNVGKRPTRSHS
jgi:GntR family transcriptional repressor for pyruvate dehydrogenase complex